MLLGLAGLTVAEPLPVRPANDTSIGAATAASSASRLISITDPKVLAGLSPLNWIRSTDAVHSPVCGASFKLAFLDTQRVVLTRIIVMVPISGKARAEVSAAVQSYLQTSKDAHTHLLDLGPVRFDVADDAHPTAGGHQAIYQAALAQFDKLVK